MINGLYRHPDTPITADDVAEQVVARIFIMKALEGFKEATREIAQMRDRQMIRAAFAELRRQAEITGLLELHGPVVLRLIIQREQRAAQ